MNTQLPIKRPRTLTRIAVIQALFQWEQGPEKTANLIIEQFFLYRLDAECHSEIYDNGKAYIPNTNLFKTIIQEYIHQSGKIDSLLESVSPSVWPMHRLDPIIRAILRAAITEMLHDTSEPPTKVIINEYIDVAHAFFDGDETKLINGILNTLGRRIRHDSTNEPLT